MGILDFKKKGISIQVVFAKHVSIFVLFFNGTRGYHKSSKYL